MGSIEQVPDVAIKTRRRAKVESPDGFKYCIDCGRNRLRCNFGSRGGSIDGLATYCRDCYRARLQSYQTSGGDGFRAIKDRQLRKAYGITLAQYER